MPVTANITVSFGENAAAGAGSHLSAEIDGRDNGLNGGDTSFAPGDRAYFLVYQSANVTHDAPVPSAGTISGAAVGSVEREEDVSFADTDTASLAVPATGIVSVTWLGRNLGGLSLVNETGLKASASGIAVARVKYTTAPVGYALQSPDAIGDESDFSILVYILGHESED